MRTEISPRLRIEEASGGIVNAYVEFAISGILFERTSKWADAGTYLAQGIAACIAGLARGEERILISTAAGRSSPSHRTGSDALYDRLSSVPDPGVYAFIAYHDEDSEGSTIFLEVDHNEIAGAVATAWEWHSFSGLVMEQPTAPFLLDLMPRKNRARRRERELETAVCVFEDWSDGTALKISTRQLSAVELSERIDLIAIAKALATPG
jgi:hypothetical protein